MNRAGLLVISLISVCISACISNKQTDRQNSVSSELFTNESGVWKALGPFGSPIPMAKEGQISPHGAGRFMCINVHPKNGSEILLGHATSGLFKSTDFGHSWQQKLGPEIVTGISSILRFRQNSKHLLACAATDIGNARQYGYGLLESFDNGETWQKNSLTYEPEEYMNDQCRDVAFTDSKKDNKLLCLSGKKILLSEDGALSWKKVFESSYNLKSIHTDPHNSGIIFVSGNCLLMSSDEGQTWTDLTEKISAACGKIKNDFIRISAGFSAVNKDKVYFVNENQSVFVLEMQSKLKPEFRLINKDAVPLNIARLAFAVEEDKKNARDILWLGTVRLFRSADGGKGFTNVGFPVAGVAQQMHDDINAIYVTEDAVFTATDGGIDWSTDGGSHWTSLSNYSTNLNTTLIFGFDISASDIIMCGTQDNGVFTYKKGKWYCAPVYGDGGRVVSMDDSTGFAAGFAQQCFYTKDAGSNFSYMHAGSESAGFDFRMAYARNSEQFYLSNMHLYRKKEGKYFELLTSSIESDRKIRALYVNPFDESDIWIAKDDPTWGSEPRNKLFHSTDAGANWNDMSASLPVLKWRCITDIHVNKNGRMAVSLEAFDKKGTELNKVYFSEDGGNSFENISEGLPNLPVNTLLYAANNWYCGTNNGIYILNGRKWEIFGKGFPGSIVTELKYSEKLDLIFASTFGRGMWYIKP